jgi:hypothetical protein
MLDRPNPITADGHQQLSGGGFTSTEAEHPLPSLALLRDRLPAPELPLHLFGPVWQERILEAAAAKNAPPDYVAAGLLVTAAGLIGNSRWAAPWDGWREPPFLWIGAVGNPSSGKSPGMDASLRDVLPELEEELAADYPEKVAAWATLAEEAKAIREVWERDVKKAVKTNLAPPHLPEGATAPCRPIRPRIVTNEPTVQKVAELLRDCPRGLILDRDELAAFIGSFDQYGGGKGGADRASWLEAFNGRPKSVDRVKSPEPILVRRFGVSIVGTIQPDRLSELIAGADDGLAPRFLWVFPEALGTFNRPDRSHDVPAWQADLARLLRLPMVPAECGEARPWYMRFSDAAADVVLGAGRDWAAREATVSGLLLGAIGKARGHMVRLAMVLELLRWCAEKPGEEAPAEVGEEAAAAAAVLLDAYFLPMAQRAYGEGALTEPERRGRTLLRHIIAQGLQVVNEREVRETRGLAGLTDAEAVKAAVAMLRHEDVLLAGSREAKAGRPRADHVVNPRLAEVSPTWRHGGER